MNLGCLVMITGRISKDVEMRMINGQNGAFATAKFTIAVNRSNYDATNDQKADFIPCEVTGKTAEFVNKYFQKGDAIMVAGTLLTYKRKDANGQYEQYANGWKVKVDQVSFVPGAHTRGQSQTQEETQQANTGNPFGGAAATNPFGGGAQTNQQFGGGFASTNDLPFDASFMGGNPNTQTNQANTGGFGFGNTGAMGKPDFSTTFLGDDAMPFN